MAVLDAEQALRCIERGQLDPVWLVTGDDAYLREAVLRAIRRAVVPEGDPGLRELAVTVFDEADDLGAVVAAARQLPWAGRRLVVAREPRALAVPRRAREAAGGAEPEAAGPEDAGDGDAAVLADYLADPAPEACLVFVAEAVDRRRSAARLLLDRATVVRCHAPDERRLPAWIARVAAARGLRLEAEAVRELALRVGRDLGRLERELEKLAAYAEGGRVDGRAVRELVPAGGELRVFDLLDAVGAGDVAGALGLARRLLDAGESPAGLLALLGRHVRRVLEAGLLRERGVDPAEIPRRLGVHPFAARRALEQAARFERSGLAAALATVLEADEGFKSGRLSAEAALTRVIVELGGCVRRRAAR